MKSPPKKLVLRVGTFPSRSETFITLQAKQAIEQGYDLAILVDCKAGLQSSAQAEIITKYKLLDRTIELKRIEPNGRLHRLITILKLMRSGMPLSVLSTLNYFRFGKEGIMGKYLLHYEEVKSFMTADIVHIHFGEYKYPFDELKYVGLLKGSLITTFHGFDAHFSPENLDVRTAFYLKLFESGDYFTVNSDYLKKKLLLLGCPSEKISVLPMPVDTDFFRPLPSKRCKDYTMLLSVGRLIALKGHEYGIRAVHRLISKGFRIRYAIVGTGEEKENLEDLISELELNEVVRLYGNQSQEEVLQLMQSADIFLMTSVQDSSGRSEAQGLVTGEAQACGLPVIAFRSGGVPSTIAEGISGFLVPEKSDEEMADRVAYLIENEEERSRMAVAARLFIERNFAHKVIEKRWAELYAEAERKAK